MKGLKLISKKVEVKGAPEQQMSSVEMIRFAIEGNEENRKGLEKIGKAIKVLDKLSAAEKDPANQVIEFEDAEVEMVYSSVNNYAWGPLALRFGEFFGSIEELKKK